MGGTAQTSAPLLGTDEVSSWSENPLFHVTRLCLAFLQGLFAQAPKGCFWWSTDPEATDLIITDDAPIDIETINKRPAIVTVRSPVAWAGIALDQLQHYDFRTGERTHTDMISGHMTFNCLSRTKVEAEQLSWLVARHCWILRRMMLKSGFHDFGQRIQILGATPPGAIIAGAGDPEIVNVPAVVPFHFQWQDTIGEVEPGVLSAIEQQITVMSSNRAVPLAPAENAPGPGLRGTALGAKLRVVRGVKLRNPWVRGRTLEYSTDTLPASQQPSDPEIELDVQTDTSPRPLT